MTTSSFLLKRVYIPSIYRKISNNKFFPSCDVFYGIHPLNQIGISDADMAKESTRLAQEKNKARYSIFKAGDGDAKHGEVLHLLRKKQKLCKHIFKC